MPPEKIAYALARYSRSPDSIHESLKWVRTHDSSKFLESFYFQYGHASIADLGHVTICFEGISELAATEIQDEQLWDGQARSSRYQDFSRSGVIVPPELTASEQSVYRDASENLLAAYRHIHEQTFRHLEELLPRPEDMKPDAYRRNITARAFDVARYLLPFGVPTGVGQVTSIRTLEKQMRRLQASEFQEVREIGEEMIRACAKPAVCVWEDHSAQESIAPTLARHVEADHSTRRLRADVAEWAAHNLSKSKGVDAPAVDLLQPSDHLADICATLVYPVTDRPYRELYERRSRGLTFAPGTAGRGPGRTRQTRRAAAAFSQCSLRPRHCHGHRRISRFSPSPAMSAIPPALHESTRIRNAGHDRQVRIGDGVCERARRGRCRHREVAATGRAIPAAVCRAIPLSFQDGSCRTRIYLAAPERGEGSLLLSQSRLGNEEGAGKS